MAEYFDVVIVGAGLSGIGAAYHLQEKCPTKSYVILEGRSAMGGTWDLFRYPGVRSDSDMHTLGYKFKPWTAAQAIADGPSILEYIQETAAENNIGQHIRYNHMVKSAAWSSEDATWTLTIERPDNGETVEIQSNFLSMCSGYYSYEEGYTPEFNGRERFQGEIVHPQKWPEDLDYAGKRVVVIGSGATAMTLIPSMADQTEHITMLQRSPTYVVARPDEDRIANFLRTVLPEKWAYNLTRWKNVAFQQYIYKQTRTNPAKVKEELLEMVRKELGPDYDVEKHFTPSYNPWDQRLCLVPNGDLFEVIRSGKASVVTDEIDTFTEQGILLKSGETLKADIIVTATGLNMVALGGAEILLDGRLVDFAEHITYKGIMYSGVPNLVSTFGYINASWTLRADLIAEYTCRLLNHMDKKGVRQCAPYLREQDKQMQTRPLIEEFSAGYIQRTLHLLPKQGEYEPWLNPQNYSHDKKIFLKGELEDGILIFGKPPAAVPAAQLAHNQA
ncbi:MAG: NAD(P)/FAD-dependent oxidoreductase [Anaerolineales bacterium]|nr:NAD(P)/FAD-dependent oxidoreductase [Anaerolineales bacterium]